MSCEERFFYLGGSGQKNLNIIYIFNFKGAQALFDLFLSSPLVVVDISNGDTKGKYLAFRTLKHKES